MADSQPGLTDESHQYQIYVTVGIAGFLQVSTTIIRVIVRLMYKLKLSWDDYFIVLGTVRGILLLNGGLCLLDNAESLQSILVSQRGR